MSDKKEVGTLKLGNRMKPEILIRVDGSQNIGLGHLVRCSALAHMLKDDFEITFYCKDIPEAILTDFVGSGFCSKRIEKEVDFFGQLTSTTIAVLDGYHFDTSYQKQVKATGAKLVCIDDLHNKEFVADMIINHTPGITPQDYHAQTYTQFALGLDYALLRPAFLEQAKKQRKIEKIETVLICFGGSDPKNLTQSALQALKDSTRFKTIIVVTGQAYQETHFLQSMVASDNRIVHRHALSDQEMLKTMLDADLAVVPASSIALEIVCCGCFLLTCFYASNQFFFHKFLVDELGVLSFGDNSKSLQHKMLVDQFNRVYSPLHTDRLYILKEKINHSESNILSRFLKLKSL